MGRADPGGAMDKLHHFTYNNALYFLLQPEFAYRWAFEPELSAIRQYTFITPGTDHKFHVLVFDPDQTTQGRDYDLDPDTGKITSSIEYDLGYGITLAHLPDSFFRGKGSVAEEEDWDTAIQVVAEMHNVDEDDVEDMFPEDVEEAFWYGVQVHGGGRGPFISSALRAYAEPVEWPSPLFGKALYEAIVKLGGKDGLNQLDFIGMELERWAGTIDYQWEGQEKWLDQWGRWLGMNREDAEDFSAEVQYVHANSHTKPSFFKSMRDKLGDSAGPLPGFIETE